uniref:PIN domain nuclease, a component of toxin-antitoxin system (PIN domain) n=1 Tax=Candidatus Kentrum sp. FW TaxID=2126338 RepID=A0A450TRG6_9GAMM|nr:MAG: PIN domain nuclease, a component of toxin-antitoxin system (PIN domain) [Candidatus Kentron sp. FW]
MKLLLDTHVFLWLNFEPGKLSDRIRSICSDSDNRIYLSMVSPWEIQIKQQLGKLKFQSPLSKLIDVQIEQNDLNLLPITLNHIYALGDLPPIHKDPFDRLLIAQSRVESMKLVSADKKFERYSVVVMN